MPIQDYLEKNFDVLFGEEQSDEKQTDNAEEFGGIIFADSELEQQIRDFFILQVRSFH